MRMMSPNLSPSARKERVMIEGVYMPKVVTPTTCFKKEIMVTITGSIKSSTMVLLGMPLEIMKFTR